MENEELVARIRTGEASDDMLQLWRQNQGIIHQIARKYCGMAEMEDLLQESYLGLHEAVQHYDTEQGVPFVNYAALWIRQALVRYIKANRIVKMPDNVQSLIRKRRKMESEWMTTTGRKPAEWEISRYLGVSENMVRQLEKNAQMGQIGSLDAPISEEEEGSYYELLPDSYSLEDAVVDGIHQEETKVGVWSLVDELPADQAAVLRMRFQHNATFKETGKAIGATVNQTRAIQEKAMRTLRSRRNRLLPFLDDELMSIALGGGYRSFQDTWTSSTERAALLAEVRLENELWRNPYLEKCGTYWN